MLSIMLFSTDNCKLMCCTFIVIILPSHYTSNSTRIMGDGWILGARRLEL